ncbi:hypothetical protein GCM10009616_37630 [Microlunatus lacustris]
MNDLTTRSRDQHRERNARPSSPSATARNVLGLPDPAPQSGARAAADRALERVGGPVGLAAATAPTVAFVAADAIAGLEAAFVALGVTAVAACAARLARRESPGAAVAGLVVAGVCAGVAALAGEARAFFLPTTVVPALFVLAYLISLAAGRPLIGFLVNPLSGGPRHWRGHPALRRTYVISTLTALTLAAANLLARVVFHLADQPTVLAAIQVGSTTVFAAHFAITLVVARRVAGRTRTSTTASLLTP